MNKDAKCIKPCADKSEELKSQQTDYDGLPEEKKKKKAGWTLWGTPFDQSKGIPRSPENRKWK